MVNIYLYFQYNHLNQPKSTKGVVVHYRYKFVLILLVLIFMEKSTNFVPWKSTRLFYTSRFLTVLSRLWVRCVMEMPWKSMAWCVNGLSQHGGPCMDIYQQVLFVKISIVSFSLRRHHAEHVHLLHTSLVQSGIYTENRYFPPLFLQYK